MKRVSRKSVIVVSALTSMLMSSNGFATNVIPNDFAEIAWSGDLEIDTSYISTSLDPGTDTTDYDLCGRIKVVPTVRKEYKNMYFEALAQILAKTNGDVVTDDVYGKIGTSTFDFQIGRFEGWSLFDKSNDMIIVDAPEGASRYEANYARGRMDDAGQLAFHYNPTEIIGFELGGIYGKQDVDSDDINENVLGVRPVLRATFGPVEAVAGVDYLKGTEQNDDLNEETEQFGYGAKVKGTFGIATLGVNYARGKVSGTIAAGADIENQITTSIGGYCDLSIGEGTFSLASFYTTWEEDNNPYEKSHAQYFAAYAHPLPFDGATIKVGVSYADATEETALSDIDSDSFGVKVRLNYDF